jgi:hypothetical protein
MKLPNFLVSGDFIRLKSSMGIPRNKLGDLRAIEIRRGGPTPDELRQLSEEGLEVDKEDVIPLPDGTLSYKGQRVILYIRDVSRYKGSYSDPRFHISDCSKLKQMRADSRFGRYVIASRDDGLFRVHYIGTDHGPDKRLDVCQNCLDLLKYKAFHIRMPSPVRRVAVQNFLVADFFAEYPKILHHSMPDYTDQTAPTNDYSPDFSLISRAYRRKRNWICETCGIPLSKDVLRRYLHVHHVNGLKNENHDANLKAVCVYCHALEPLHGHVKAMRQYREFEATWQRWRQTGVVP